MVKTSGTQKTITQLMHEGCLGKYLKTDPIVFARPDLADYQMYSFGADNKPIAIAALQIINSVGRKSCVLSDARNDVMLHELDAETHAKEALKEAIMRACKKLGPNLTYLVNNGALREGKTVEMDLYAFSQMVDQDIDAFATFARTYVASVDPSVKPNAFAEDGWRSTAGATRS
jgi:hypothetical protein